jgi:hypothetical protein
LLQGNVKKSFDCRQKDNSAGKRRLIFITLKKHLIST